MTPPAGAAEAGPNITNFFAPSVVAHGSTSTLTFTLINPPGNTADDVGVAFSSTLPTGLIGGGSASQCGGTLTVLESTMISFSGGTVPANGTCQVSVTVTTTTDGVFTDTAGPATSNNGGSGDVSSNTLTVVTGPQLTQTFGQPSIPQGTTTSLTFTLTNPNSFPTATFTGVRLSDTFVLGADLLIQSPPLLDTCSGTLTSLPSTSGVGLSGLTLAPLESCSLALTVKGFEPGQVFSEAGLDSDQAAGTTNTTDLTVLAPQTGGASAADFGLAVDDGSTLQIGTPGLLAGATGSGQITVTGHSAVTHGTLSVGADGSFTYTPAVPFSGTDSFTYTVTDSQGSTATGTVSVGITPVIVNQSYDTLAGQTLHVPAPGLLTGSLGTSVTATGLSSPAHGTVNVNPDGSFDYVPAPGFTGVDSFLFEGMGGDETSAGATATITVRPGVRDQTFTTTAGQNLTVGPPGLLSGSSGSSLRAEEVTAAAHGAVTVNQDGSFTYFPTSGFSGTDTFTFQATDGTENSTAATATITVMAPVVPPVPPPKSAPVAFGGTVVVPSGADGSGGAFVLAPPTGSGPFRYAVGRQPALGTVVVDPDTGTFTYDGPPGFSGKEVYTYTVTDQTGLISAPALVNVLVEPPPAYRLVGADGGIFDFGSAPFERSCVDSAPSCGRVIGGASFPNGLGYWLAGTDGGVFSFGQAPFFGSLPGLGLRVDDIVAMAATPDGGGYWLLGAEGAVYAFGDARYAGSLPGLGVTVDDVVGVAPTADGGGYWLVGADGAVYAFGDARYAGSLPGLGLTVDDVVGVAPTADGGGYWLAGADGGVFAFGDAPYLGNATRFHLQRPLVGIVAGPNGGYWLVAADGGVFSFAPPFLGSNPGIGFWPAGTLGVPKVLNAPIVGILTSRGP